tara:strand:- start:814 stop:1185 length:372 start_codon:yes stop_codon:yes gene_type:complete
MSSTPTKLLQQRIRNRIIEYFDTSFEEIAKWGAFETINMWEDVVPHGWDKDFFSEPVFSKEEQAHIKQFCSTLERTAEATPIDIFDVNTLLKSRDWSNFIHGARSAFEHFSERGKFSEDIEQF